MKIFLNYLFIVILCFFLGCEDENSDGIQIPSKVIISPLNLILKPDQSAQLYALVIDEKNKEIDDAKVVWSSENKLVAVVNDRGFVIAKAKGSTTIRALAEDVVGIAEISVATTRRRILSEMFTSST